MTSNSFQDALQQEPSNPYTTNSYCWLDTPTDSSSDPSIYQHNSELADSLQNRSLALETICSDMNRRLPTRKDSRTHPTCAFKSGGPTRSLPFPVVKRDETGLTIAMLYYANPGILLTQLEAIIKYPTAVKEQISLLIIDDGSPPDLRVSDYISKSMAQLLKLRRFQLIYIQENLAFNMGGGKNLAMSLSSTRKTVLLDLDTIVPTETMELMLRFSQEEEGHKALRFNRKFSDGTSKFHPAVTMLDTDEFWRAGGFDEDFTGSYGHDDTHYWYRWRQKGNVSRSEIYQRHVLVHQVEDNTVKRCPDDTTQFTVCGEILFPQELCVQAAANMPKLVKDPLKNYELMKLKKKNNCWSNIVIRFPWKEVWDVRGCSGLATTISNWYCRFASNVL